MTTYKYKPKDKIHIPTDWTGEQAKIVWEFLVEEIGRAIWDVYDQKLTEAIEKEETLLERAARGEDEFANDDYPF